MGEAAANIQIEPQVPASVVEALEGVVDPEIPVLTIRDLGVLRGVRMEDVCVVVTITPTYSGCPAMVEIQDNIDKALRDAGVESFRIETRLAPAWTTDWMSETGKRKLEEYGIAPPRRNSEVGCPQCGSANTKLVSQFGSTACKALYQCNACLEPFDHFKCH